MNFARPCRSGMLAALALATVACGSGGSNGSSPPPPTAGELTILSGSENKSLEPLVMEYARRSGARIALRYSGSVDISLELSRGTEANADAVWPANSLWIDLGDRQHVVKDAKSIMRSPVLFGVRKSVAQRLGWAGGPGSAPVTVRDIVDTVSAGKLSFAMTSATQSNSGASFYLAALNALAGSPDALTEENLADPKVQEPLKKLLRAVNRSSGSSGWLKDYFVEHPLDFDAMVNYEAVIIEANQAFVRAGQEPLCAVYPSDGLAIADYPLAYIDKGDATKSRLFHGLQEFLLSPTIQERIQGMGRRAGELSGATAPMDRAIFNPDWCIDPDRVISPVPTPRPDVLRSALVLYQTVLRKPSWTVFVLDFSGSMKGESERQVKLAMRTLLEPDVAQQFLLQASPEDRNEVIAFSDHVLGQWQANGNDPEELRDLLAKVNLLQADGGTRMYDAAAQAVGDLSQNADQLDRYFPAIIVMSDGKSDGNVDVVQAALQRVHLERAIPIFTLAFGDADEEQLGNLAKVTGGRMFDARKDLVAAFRDAKGYN